MARNDEFFLNRWISYYGKLLGEENLYLYLDGTDQKAPSGAGKTNIFIVEKQGYHVVDAEKKRLAFLSDKAKELLTEYDLVIGCDADEFIVVDPALQIQLPEYLSQIKIKTSVSGLGLDFGQHLKTETALDLTKPFLEQREYALISTRYTKTSIIAKPVSWGSGFHRIRKHNFHIDKNLYLLHFGNADYNALKARFDDQDFINTGRIRHLKKRIQVIEDVTNKIFVDGDKIFAKARKIQTFCRPIYAWNKPSMLKMRKIIKIPKRFKELGI
ncbi:MAG: glycosyltransferase family 2 protein [Marinilabiliaceae bacterium]|nr:glycosyltransferase family 2 protein [Marinilabiliaceae bacterium]